MTESPETRVLAVLPAIEQTLAALQRGEVPAGLTDFEHLKDVVGFPLYYLEEERYLGPKRSKER
jgi:hypothetical protein